MSDEPEHLDEVERRLKEIQRRKRGRIRWNIGRHTAEMAIVALETAPKSPPRSGKSRRRKRWKRLL
jgi:hypothetical protein